MDDLISRQAALDAMETWDKFGYDPDGKLVRYDDDKHYIPYVHYEDMVHAIKHLPSAQPERTQERTETHACDLISRQAAIDAIDAIFPVEPMKNEYTQGITCGAALAKTYVEQLPSVQPKRKWTPCNNPPKHHKDVIVRGIEAIGNVTVHKVMQWDVDTWRPTDYAPSVMWKEWSEI